MSPTKKSPTKKEAKPKTKTTPKKTITKKQTKTSKSKINQEQKQALFSPKIEKITVNIGVGEAGERLKKAETVLQNLTKHKPVETLSKTTNKDWGLRKSKTNINQHASKPGGVVAKHSGLWSH